MILLLFTASYLTSLVACQKDSKITEESQRKEIYFVYQIAYTSASASIKLNESSAYENPSVFATGLIAEGYGIGGNDLVQIIEEGDKNGWSNSISSPEMATNISVLVMEADLEGRILTLDEIQTLISVESKEKTVEQLAEELVAADNVLSKQFVSAAAALELHNSSLSEEEIEYVIDANIRRLEFEYDTFGKREPGATVYELRTVVRAFEPVLQKHDEVTRQILEERLTSNDKKVAALAALLLAYHGDQNSLTKLQAAKDRFVEDKAYQFYIDFTISILEG